MNVNTITKSTENYESGKLPIGLYKSYMKYSDGKSTGYYGRALSRTSLTMQNIAEDLIVTKSLEDYTAEQIVNVWNAVNGAVIDRVLNGFIVNAGIGCFQARVNGTFTSLQDTYDSTRHSIDIGFRSSSEVKEMASEIEPLILYGKSVDPVISSVTDVASKEDGVLTPNNMVNIEGKNIRICGDNEDVGIYFINTENDEKSAFVAPESIGVNKSTIVSCLVPDLDAGTYKIKLVTQYSKSSNLKRESSEFTTEDEFIVKS